MTLVHASVHMEVNGAQPEEDLRSNAIYNSLRDLQVKSRHNTLIKHFTTWLHPTSRRYLHHLQDTVSITHQLPHNTHHAGHARNDSAEYETIAEIPNHTSFEYITRSYSSKLCSGSRVQDSTVQAASQEAHQSLYITDRPRAIDRE